jgi:hypothetical protein
LIQQETRVWDIHNSQFTDTSGINDEVFVGEKMKDYLQIPPAAPWAVTVFSRVLHEIFFIWRAPSLETPLRYVQEGSGNVASVSL